MILAGGGLVKGLLLLRGGVSWGAREGLLVIAIRILLLHLVIPSLSLPSSSLVIVVIVIVLVVVVSSHSVSLLALGASKIIRMLILVMVLGGRLILARVPPRAPTCGCVIQLLLYLVVFIMGPLRLRVGF
jgi:hypothetical protein